MVWLDDLSKNGTYINGSLVGKGNPVKLCDGDIIAVGQIVHEGKIFFYKITTNTNNFFLYYTHL